MRREGWTELGIVAGMFAIVAVIFLVWMGPQGLTTSITGWKASAYGSDWLVVQYAQSGCVINYWVLEDQAVHNEQNSDGVYFIDSRRDDVVHVSGHYVYVQNPSYEVLAELLSTGKCSGEPWGK